MHERWQQIDGAPRDGSVIIGYDPSRDGIWMNGVEFMRWVDGEWTDPATHTCKPTHWIPLPEPPKGERMSRLDEIRQKCAAARQYGSPIWIDDAEFLLSELARKDKALSRAKDRLNACVIVDSHSKRAITSIIDEALAAEENTK